MASSPKKTTFLPGIMTLGFLLIAVPVVFCIIVAVWLAGAAAFENVKFARCTEQAISIIALAQDNSTKDPSFGAVQNEDIIDDLMRRGQIITLPRNAWGGAIRATIQPQPLMRFETDLPSYACKRLALFLGKNAVDLRLLKMEAHEDGANWQTFYDAAYNSDASELPGVNAACGKTLRSTIALTFKLR